MMPNPLEELFSKLAPEAGAAAGVLPPDRLREVDHFNVFTVADLMLSNRDRPPMIFDRRAFYKISLIWGRSRMEYADQVVDIEQSALWFVTSRVPYRWLPHDREQIGYFCVFTDKFLLPAKGRTIMEELPVSAPRLPGSESDEC